MPKVNPKHEAGREPNPNVLRKGEDFGGYCVVNPPSPPEAKQSEKAGRTYKGETPRRLKSWNAHRPKATGHRK